MIFTGLGLYTTSEVRFGTQAAVFTVDSDGQLTVTVPAAAAAGPVEVTVTTRGGIASGVTYTYLNSPSITAVTLDSGPVDGGNLVVITGTAFSCTTSVTFDGTPAPSYRIASDTEIDALVPAGALGSANVSVTTTTASDAYTYLGRFAVLGGASVTNTGLPSVTGGLGVNPGVSITGFPPGQVNGTIPPGPGKLLFGFFAAMAETERENIRESTLEGLESAARKGKYGGRPRSSPTTCCTPCCGARPTASPSSRSSPP